jgi:hypothetical protein
VKPYIIKNETKNDTGDGLICIMSFRNFQRVDEIGQVVLLHSGKGLSVKMDGWSMKLFDEFKYTMEGTLVHLEHSVGAHVMPCGEYQCGCCMSMHTKAEMLASGMMRMDISCVGGARGSS